jgi:hypothetical protein
MGTAKVIGYQKTFRRSGDFGYQQHITSVIWKALVLSHSTVTRKHVPPQNTAADRPRSSSAQRLTSKMHGHNRRHLGSRNAERRLRDPTGLTDPHSRTSNPARPPHHGGKNRRPDPQPPRGGTPNPEHVGGENAHEHGTLRTPSRGAMERAPHPDAPKGPPTPLTRVRSRRAELNKKASEAWRQYLFGKVDPTSDAPTDALHQYVITAHTDLLRKNLYTPQRKPQRDYAPATQTTVPEPKQSPSLPPRTPTHPLRR